jgi:hypothetical protein
MHEDAQPTSQLALYTARRCGRIVPDVITEDDDLATVPQQHRPEPQRPRIAPAEVLFERPCRDEHHDVLDALAALGRPTDQRC